MTELEQLKNDYATVCRAIEIMQPSGQALREMGKKKCKIRDRILELEAEAADPWRRAKNVTEAIEIGCDVAVEYQLILARYVRHLETENIRLKAENEVREVPPLDPERVMRTAMDYASTSYFKYSAEWSAAEPYKLKE